MPYGLAMAELPFPTPPLADDVVLLRPWREADLPGTAPYTEADARTYFAEQQETRLLGEELSFAFAEPQDGWSHSGCSLSWWRGWS